mgnify:CR=1 FL=1
MKKEEADLSTVINLSPSDEEEFTSDPEETLTYWNSVEADYMSNEWCNKDLLCLIK